jgi:hypothetical protein
MPFVNKKLKCNIYKWISWSKAIGYTCMKKTIHLHFLNATSLFTFYIFYFFGFFKGSLRGEMLWKWFTFFITVDLIIVKSSFLHMISSRNHLYDMSITKKEHSLHCRKNINQKHHFVIAPFFSINDFVRVYIWSILEQVHISNYKSGRSKWKRNGNEIKLDRWNVTISPFLLFSVDCFYFYIYIFYFLLV